MLETSARHALIDSFMVASHGDLKGLSSLHDRALQEDPLLYGPLARWYQQHGAIRDHHELFVAHCLASPFPEHREHGLVLLQSLRPYQVARVVRFLKETLKYSTRIARTAVKTFLRRREADVEWFDECCIRDSKSMKYLYATLRIKPGPRAEQILFQGRPPTGSRVEAVKKLFRLKGRPDQQASLIREHHIHFTTARGAVTNYTPAVLRALVEVMTPAQLITNLSFIEKRGGLRDEGLRRVVAGKLEHAVTESRVSEFKALVAMQQLNLDRTMADQLLEMIGQRLRRRGVIRESTALLVDKSGSMESCITIGRLLASLCSTICDADMWVEAFDSASFRVSPSRRNFGGWEEAFRRVRASGATSVGVSVRKLQDEDFTQLVLISDGEENTRPFFVEEVQEYERRWNRKLKIVWIRVGSAGQELESQMSRARLLVTRIDFKGDYYNLPNVVPLLCSGEHRQLVEEVLACPLYSRDDVERLPPQFDPETYEIL